jgi:hypothetical protein
MMMIRLLCSVPLLSMDMLSMHYLSLSVISEKKKKIKSSFYANKNKKSRKSLTNLNYFLEYLNRVSSSVHEMNLFRKNRDRAARRASPVATLSPRDILSLDVASEISCDQRTLASIVAAQDDGACDD